jgi:hypothetical protein
MAEKFDPSKSPAPLPIERIDEPDIRVALSQCGAIIGVNMKTLDQTMFYGQKMLNDMLLGRGSEWGNQSVARIAVDYETDDPARLAAFVKEIKGECDFSPG